MNSDKEHHKNRQPRQEPRAKPELLTTGKVQIERKTFFFALMENARGRFLRITEEVGGRFDAIVIPAPGLEAFRDVLEGMLKAERELPPATS